MIVGFSFLPEIVHVRVQTPSSKVARLTLGSPEGGSELPDMLLFWVTVDSQLDGTMV